MASIVEVDDDSYEAVIEDERLVLLYFRAEWCGPCRVLDPVLEDLTEEFPSLVIATIDADESETAMDAYGVESIPTLILFERGEPVDVFTGKVPYPTFANRLQRYD